MYQNFEINRLLVKSGVGVLFPPAPQKKREMEKQFIETENVIEPAATRQDDLTAEERASWLQSIERDMRIIAEGKPPKYYSLDEFGKELMAAVESK